MNHLSPKQFRFPRSYREAFGVDRPEPLPDRITFLKEPDGNLGDALIAIVAVIVLLFLLF